MRYIYGLVCPVIKKVRYVGVSDNPDKRYHQHLDDMGGTDKTVWIQSLLAIGLTPGLLILSEVDDSVALQEESSWIRFGIRVGWPLTNEMILESAILARPEYRSQSIETIERYVVPKVIRETFRPSMVSRLLGYKGASPSDVLEVFFNTVDNQGFTLYYEYVGEDVGGQAIYANPSAHVIWAHKATMTQVVWGKILALRSEQS